MAASTNVWALTSVLLIVLCALPVFAAEDFTATGTGRILATACSPAQGEITVFNTGTFSSVYEIAAEGTAKGWVTFVPDFFELAPGQSAKVQEYLALPCDAEDAFLDVVIATEELELLLAQDVIVQPPDNLQLVPQVYSQSILPCDTAEFTFLLHNPADFTETYSLKVLDAPVPALLSEKKLTLTAGMNETIAITFEPEDCSFAGDFTPVLEVSTDKSRITAAIEMFLRINDSDIPILAEGVGAIRAGFEPQEASFAVENTGNRVTTYSLSIDGAPWITVQPEQITVDARDSETVKLVLQPTETTAAGKHDITLTALVEATGKEYAKGLVIKLGPPTFFENLFTAWLPFTIGGIVALIILIILIVAGVKKYNSPESQAKRAEARAERERRKAEKAAEKEAKLAARAQAKQQKIDDKQRRKAEQAADEERRAKEAEKHAREIERERARAEKAYDRKIRKDNLVIPNDSIVLGMKMPGKKLLKLALLLLILIIVAFGLTFRATLAANSQAVMTGLVVLIVIYLLHRLRRMRTVRRRWKLALANKLYLADTKWRKGLTQVSFKLNTVVEKLAVLVRRRKPSLVPPTKYTYKTFAITANVDNYNVMGARLKFAVKKSWLLRNRISPDTVQLLRLDNDRWQNILAEPVSTDDKYVYYVADSDGFGEFAIIGKPGKRASAPRPSIDWHKVSYVIFGIVAVIALISLGLVLPNNTPTVGIPSQAWKQDTQHTLDLGQYFKDPDGDALTFSATRADNIEILFIDDRALLTPHYGWSGHERVVFMADDGNGGIVKSNPVDLIVEKDVIPSAWKRNAKAILSVSALVLIILGIILFRKQIKKIVGLD
jgi:PGF-pre-PGF domain-containing protein